MIIQAFCKQLRSMSLLKQVQPQHARRKELYWLWRDAFRRYYWTIGYNQVIPSTGTTLLTRMIKFDGRLISSRAKSKSHSDMENNVNERQQQEENGKHESHKGDVASSSSSIALSSLVNDQDVAVDQLTAEEMEIYTMHRNACEAGQSSYTDPSTGYVVLTQRFHITRGKCCGNCCRHCPYGHASVPEKYRTKTFNTAFYS